jgi:hypothetical protein
VDPVTGFSPREPEEPGAQGRYVVPGESMPLAPSSAPPAMRASDGEREQVVRVLTDACAEGRLTLEELGGRVGAAYGAVTRAELVPLTVDLPVGSPIATPVPADLLPVEPAVKVKRKWLVSVMSEHKHTGHWRLSARTVGVTVMGEMSIDLRNAMIESPELHLSLYLLMGQQTVIVPQGVEVEVSGFVFMGERKVKVDSTRPRPGVPRLHIRVIGMMGEVDIETA